jgi:hypothetical protein
MLPSALLTASASQPRLISELNLHGLLLCCVRFDTHRSPDEWQHSLPACSLALTGRDLHPLDFSKWFPLFHCWFLHFHAFPSAIRVEPAAVGRHDPQISKDGTPTKEEERSLSARTGAPKSAAGEKVGSRHSL